MLAGSLIRQDLVPMVTGYLLVMAALGIGLRRLHRPGARSGQAQRQADAYEGWPRASIGSRRGWPALIRHVIGTAAGGYVLLMAVVIAYYYGVARAGGHFLESAFTGTTLLIGIAAPVFSAASWLAERRSWRSSGTGGEDPAHSP
jgi:uncharacterized protein DUF6256